MLRLDLHAIVTRLFFLVFAQIAHVRSMFFFLSLSLSLSLSLDLFNAPSITTFWPLLRYP